jgi:hypothetical protein
LENTNANSAAANHEKSAQTKRAQTPAQAQPQTQQVKWDDSNLKSSYANVCNVSSSRSEVVMVFGINQDWERPQQDVKVQLTDRIILSPYAAKRLADLLNGVMAEYEKRFGPLKA